MRQLMAGMPRWVTRTAVLAVFMGSLLLPACNQCSGPDAESNDGVDSGMDAGAANDTRADGGRDAENPESLDASIDVDLDGGGYSDAALSPVDAGSDGPDGSGDASLEDAQADGANPPLDSCWDDDSCSPEAIAPPLDPTVPTSTYDATKFIYTGHDPIQRGVKAGVINPVRVAVLRGKVLERDGSGLSGVEVKVFRHGEFGRTETNREGVFTMVVNGGGMLSVEYRKPGYLPARRRIRTGWEMYSWLPDVVLVPHSGIGTSVSFPNTSTEVARGAIEEDGFGSRQATLLIAPNTRAVARLFDGSIIETPTLTIRATEYTVGPSGPEAMPAILPPASAYTYAVELQADEALDLGARSIELDKPAAFYLENFLGFPSGGLVPAGYFDAELDQWIASDNGRIVKLVGVQQGLADLDIDGDDVADAPTALAELGVTAEERARVALLYAVGATLWRVPIKHFTPYDFNWPVAVDEDLRPKLPPPEKKRPNPKPDCKKGCFIEVENQVLREELPIAGTSFRLSYSSERSFGANLNNIVTIPLSGEYVKGGLKRIELSVDVAGQHFEQVFPPLPNQSTLFQWDGKDAFERVIQGQVKVGVTVSYVYPGEYAQPANVVLVFLPVFNRASTGGAFAFGNFDRSEVTISQYTTLTLGSWNADGLSLGGWSLSPHHAYDSVGHTLYRGDARRIDNTGGSAVVNAFAGTGENDDFNDKGVYPNTDGLPATTVPIGGPQGIRVGPDGSVYFTEYWQERVRRVRPDGTLETIAGTGREVYGNAGWDGSFGTCFQQEEFFLQYENSPARSADLKSPWDVALGQDGSVYFINMSDYYSNFVERVLPDGRMVRVAGKGACDDAQYELDGQIATDVSLFVISIDVGPDDSLYFVNEAYVGEFLGDPRREIYRLDGSGVLVHIAGTGEACPDSAAPCGDGGSAVTAQLSEYAGSLRVADDGSVYFIDGERVRRITPAGMIETVAGKGTCGSGCTGGPQGDGGPALEAGLARPADLAIDPSGRIYIADSEQDRIRAIDTTGTIWPYGGAGAPGDTGDFGPAMAAGFELGGAGMAVGPAGRLSFGQALSNHVRIRRISEAFPGRQLGDTLIPSGSGKELYHFDPQGRHIDTSNIETGAFLYTFHYDSAGRLEAIEDAFANVTQIERDGSGNPSAIVAPFGQRTELEVNAEGHLSAVIDPEGNENQFTYHAGTGLFQTATDPVGRVSEYAFTEGRLTSEVGPDGRALTLERSESTSGTTTVTLTESDGGSTVYSIDESRDGSQVATTTFPDSTVRTRFSKPDGSLVYLYPDGTQLTTKRLPDPVWGMLRPTSASTVEFPSGLSSTTKYTREVTQTTPLDSSTVTQWIDRIDLDGDQIVSVHDLTTSTETTTLPTGRSKTQTLDDFGRSTAFSQPGVEPISLSYDTRGRVEHVDQGSDSEARTLTLEYNPSTGYLAETRGPTPADDVVKETDALGRSLTVWRGDLDATEFDYNAAGNISSITPPGRPAHEFTLSPADDIESHTAPAPDPLSPPSTTSYSYDLARRPTIITLPGGEMIQYEYDPVSYQLNSIATPDDVLDFTYTPSTGKIASVVAQDGERVRSLAYNYDGYLPKKTTWGGDADAVKGSVSFAWGKSLRLSSFTVNTNTSIKYLYDADGVVTSAGSLTLQRDPATGFLTSSRL